MQIGAAGARGRGEGGEETIKPAIIHFEEENISNVRRNSIEGTEARGEGEEGRHYSPNSIN